MAVVLYAPTFDGYEGENLAAFAEGNIGQLAVLVGVLMDGLLDQY